MPLYNPIPQAVYINVKDAAYGAKGDGSTDDTTAIAAALSAANSAGGGVVFFPVGTYISGNQTLYANVNIVGSGVGATTIKLKNGTNVDLFSAQTGSINLSAAANSGSVGTLLNFSIQSMTLDGNKSNQSSTSYPLRFYGYNFILRDLEVTNGFSDGALIDWNGGGFIGSGPEMESIFDNIKFHDNNGAGLRIGGPHDSRWNNVNSYSNGSHNFHLAPNSNGMLITNSHGYLCPNTTGICCWLVEATSGCEFVNCEAEGSFYNNLVLLGNDMSWVGGKVFAQSVNWTNTIGIQLGQNAGQTPFPGQINQSAGVTTAVTTSGAYIATEVNECHGAGMKYVNEGNSFIHVNTYQSGGTVTLGTPSTTDEIIHNVNGITADGTLATSGYVQHRLGATFSLMDKDGNIAFQVNGKAPTGFAINTSVNANSAAVIGPDADNRNCLTLFPNSSSQSVPLFVVQNPSFANVFTVDKNGNLVMLSSLAIGTGINTGIAALVTPSADNQQGLLLFPHSGTQSVPLITVQNASFANVFTVDKDGNTAATTLATAQSASAAALAASGTITTANIGEARVAPTANVNAVVLGTGTVAGQLCSVVNQSAFSVQFAASATSNVAIGTAEVVPPNSMRIYQWNSANSLWYGITPVGEESASAPALATSGTITTAGVDEARVAPTANVTAVVLGTGTYPNQRVVVVNESASSITMAASGTSHVADGTSAIISANRCMFCQWDSAKSLWYHS